MSYHHLSQSCRASESLDCVMLFCYFALELIDPVMVYETGVASHRLGT